MPTGVKGGRDLEDAWYDDDNDLQVRFRTVGGVRIRYANSGGPYETTVVLTSP